MRPLPGSEAHPTALQSSLEAALASRPGQAPRTRHVASDRTPLYTNRRALESSPYLLQHAHNPVNWYAWGDEAFAEARRLGRPVFLSIGYSTCHWCHVMEEESFEDETIAGFLNAHYVAIKVDREERPDVDAVYMRAAQDLTGSGGWPLSVWLTAEREPFFVGTYFPPYAGRRGAGHGFIDLLTELARLFDEDPKRVYEAARALTGAVRAEMEGNAGRADGMASPTRPDVALIAAAVDQCAHAFDDENGGLRVAQKFPSHVPNRLLLRHHQRTGDAHALHMAVHTLEHMAAGGIYDHLVGGFHRYATDPRWLVPHFEKMLYDNALLVVAYAEAWQVTKRQTFARVVRETCDELLATFTSPDGGFYSATDADSDGVEGKYFVWSEDEIRAVLGASEDTELFLQHYGVTRHGNFEGGSILHQAQPDEGITQALAPARAKLADVRKRRVPPLRDEKILAAWNGLAISAFAVAGLALPPGQSHRPADRDCIGGRAVSARDSAWPLRPPVRRRRGGQDARPRRPRPRSPSRRFQPHPGRRRPRHLRRARLGHRRVLACVPPPGAHRTVWRRGGIAATLRCGQPAHASARRAPGFPRRAGNGGQRGRGSTRAYPGRGGSRRLPVQQDSQHSGKHRRGRVVLRHRIPGACLSRTHGIGLRILR